MSDLFAPNALVLGWEGDLSAGRDVGIHHCLRSSCFVYSLLQMFYLEAKETVEMNLLRVLNGGNDLYTHEK